MKKVNTCIYPIIRDDLIEKSLETLYKYTEHNFYVYVIDQTVNGLPSRIINDYVHLYFRPRRNLGFSKACNTAIRVVDTPYFTLCNDDVEFISSHWWQGVLNTFEKVDKATPDKPCVMVCPASTKLPDWSIGRPRGDHHYIVPHKENYTDEDWNFLVNEPHYINEHLTIQPGSVIDGVVMYAPVFKKDRFDRVGLLPEQFYPGSGEDYWWGARANMMGYRSVGTTLSWVFHHWSSSLSNQSDYAQLINEDLRWNDNNADWGEAFDIWGYPCPVCSKRMTSDDGVTATCVDHPASLYSLPQVKLTDL